MGTLLYHSIVLITFSFFVMVSSPPSFQTVEGELRIYVSRIIHVLSLGLALHQAVETNVLRVLFGGTMGHLHWKVLPARSSLPGNTDRQVSYGVTGVLGRTTLSGRTVWCLQASWVLGAPWGASSLDAIWRSCSCPGCLSPTFLRSCFSSAETRDIRSPGWLE